MAECDVCGEEESMPYQCKHCGGTYCGDHRLPESHDCPGLDQWEGTGPVFDSGFNATLEESSTDSRAAGLAERIGIDTGPGGHLAYFRGNMTYTFLALMWLTLLAQWIALAIGDRELHDALFTLSSEQIGFVWTWVTSVFAHAPLSITHIVFNSIVIFFFGRLVERHVGSRDFALLFIISGVLAGLGQVFISSVLQDVTVNVLGASGAALAIMGVLTVLNPNLTVYLYFILPVPIWVLTGGTVVISTFLIAFVGAGAGGIAHVAHLVGVVIGLLYGQQIKGQVRVPRQIQFGGGRGPGGPGRGGGRGPF